MSCGVGEVTEKLENELCSQLLYYSILYIILYFVVSCYKNINFLLILKQGFKQKGKRLQKQVFKTLRGLLVMCYYEHIYNSLVLG